MSRLTLPLRHGPGFLFMVLATIGLGYQAKSSSGPKAGSPTPDQVAFFETRIRPVLVAQCLPCHGKKSHQSGLALDTKAGFLKGGDSGTLLVAGDPDKSLLVQAIRQLGSVKMPQGGKLKPGEISDIESWVRMGAPWPDDLPKKAPVDQALWSLQPVRSPAVPKVHLKGWVVNPIDAFVLSALEAKNLKPSPSADRRTLLRRVTYDLTGLPPTAAEIDAFVTDKRADAYDVVVDRLLGSPRYGERWLGTGWMWRAMRTAKATFLTKTGIIRTPTPIAIG